MADKKVYVSNDGGVGAGLVMGVILVALVVFGILFYSGALNFGKRSVDVNIEAPKMDAPAVPKPDK
jgi:hypothetical protein